MKGLTFGNSMYFKLGAAFLLIGMVPMASIGYYAFQTSRAEYIEYAGELLHAEASAILDKLDAILFERYGDAQAFAANPAALQPEGQLTPILNRYTRIYGVYDLMVVADKDGKIVAHNTVAPDGRTLAVQGLLGRSVKGEPWFEECVSGRIGSETYCQDLREDPLVAQACGGRGLTLTFAAPVRDEKGEIVRVWSTRASWERLVTQTMIAHRERLKTEEGMSTIETQILAKNGLVLDDADSKAILTLNLAEAGLEAARAVSQGKAGYIEEPHKRRGVQQLNGYAASKGVAGFKGFGWGALVRQDSDEASAPAHELRNTVLLACFVATLLIVAIGLLLSRGIAAPVARAAQAIQAVSQGDLSRRIEKLGRDEIGQLSMAVNATVDHLKTIFKSERVDWEQVAAELQRVKQFNQMMDASPTSVMLADRNLKITYLNRSSLNGLRQLAASLPVPPEKVLGSSIDIFHKNPEKQRRLLADPKNLPFRTKIQVGPDTADLEATAILDQDGKYVGAMVTWSIITAQLETERREREANEAIQKMVKQLAENATALAAAAEELSAISSQMTNTATETSNQAGVASAASEQVNKSVQAVASGTEEMSASIKEISSNASEATRMAQRAVETVEKTNASMIKLGESSNEIGEIIDVINTIAEQTNLLALNATIEAARAGEAGKGFAVVANEVKELAKETAKATENIKNKIRGIQEESGGAIEAIRLVTEGIAKMTETFSTIAAAVEEQTATANEISRSLGEVAQGSGEITRNIHGVAKSAHETSSGAEETRKAAGELAQLAASLQQLVQTR